VGQDQSPRDDASGVLFEAHIERDPTLTVVVRGEIDLSTVADFAAVLDEAMREASSLVIDFSGTTFLDSTGLSVLVGAHRRLGQGRSGIVLRAPSGFVRRALTVSGVDDLVTIEDG
jgi:anti-sigma B factor antagonist